MSRDLDKASARLLRCFDDACQVIEKENSLLVDGKLSEAVALLKAKQQHMEKLEHALAADTAAPVSQPEGRGMVAGTGTPDVDVAVAAVGNPQDALAPSSSPALARSPKLNDAARRFADLASRNRVLLRNAIDTQNALLKLIVVDAVQDAGTGYGASGRYTMDTQAHGALALRSDV